MFDAFIRSGPYLLFTALIAGILGWVMSFLLQPMAAAEGAQDSMLYQSLSIFSDAASIIIIGGVALFVGLIAAAVVDSAAGVR